MHIGEALLRGAIPKVRLTIPKSDLIERLLPAKS
jgi:hypothetical protein